MERNVILYNLVLCKACIEASVSFSACRHCSLL